MSEHDELFRREAVDAQGVMNGKTRLAPLPSWSATNALLSLLVAGGLAFAANADYSKMVNAAGIVDAAGGTPRIITDRTGTLAIKVAQGDIVEKGQVIAILDITTRDSDGDLEQRRKQQSEIEASASEARGAAALAAGSSRAQAREAVGHAARARMASLHEQLEQAENQTMGAVQDLNRATEIAERGFLSRRDLEAREASLSAKREAEARIRADMATVRGDMLSAIAEAEEARSEARETYQDALSNAARARRSAMDGSAVSSVAYVTPIAGEIASLPARNGDRAAPGELIAVVARTGAPLIARLEVPADLMANVEEGQEIRIAVDAYPYQTFGTIRSRIISVSNAARRGSDGYVFDVEAEVPRTIKAYGKRVQLLPGMTLSARIKTKGRSLIEWVLDPLYAVTRR
ncbi:HlyD family secretion protein [Altericroceibacterium xinjiangense]|uniref:HlyD family secretion protein n=1 Tax=Altericroceibacterium xinjiangense TaxID=762261 RepID=UPI000F7E0064|nr:HlyD family efflux transporter periplasmic adaptor subunit [Altericroceibacterium xinjiangense]